MSEEDSGLPEESAAKLEQTNAVFAEGLGPWRNPGVTGPKQIFEDINDLYKYGEEVSTGGRKKQIVIVVDNKGTGVLYPDQPHYWMIERLPMDPVVLADNPDEPWEFFFETLYEAMVAYKEQGILTYPKPRNSIQAGTYQGVPVYLPDPVLDYSRPGTTTESTTGKTTGTSVQTTTTKTPGTAGVVTTSETLPAEVPEKEYTTVVTKGVDEDGFSYTETKRVEVPAGSSSLEPTPAIPPPPPPAEVAQRQANQKAAKTTAAKVQTGSDPCTPNNPPVSSGASSAGSVPPASKNITASQTAALLNHAKKAAAAAPASVLTEDPLDAFGGSGPNITTPTTVTQATSSPAPGIVAPTASNSANVRPRPTNVYIYEALTPGFDRYDFNTGKKVYTPNTGTSRNNNGQTAALSGGSF